MQKIFYMCFIIIIRYMDYQIQLVYIYKYEFIINAYVVVGDKRLYTYQYT